MTQQSRVHIVVRYQVRDFCTEHTIVSVWSDQSKAEQVAEENNAALGHAHDDMAGFFVLSKTLDLP